MRSSSTRRASSASTSAAATSSARYCSSPSSRRKDERISAQSERDARACVEGRRVLPRTDRAFGRRSSTARCGTWSEIRVCRCRGRWFSLLRCNV
eukprot:3492476-Rhodomonas_salina.1